MNPIVFYACKLQNIIGIFMNTVGLDYNVPGLVRTTLFNKVYKAVCISMQGKLGYYVHSDNTYLFSFPKGVRYNRVLLYFVSQKN